MRILLVDDSRTMRIILRDILAPMGADCVEAADGREGLSIVEQAGPFDLMLVDWNMPRMDGLAMIRQLRGQGYQSPIIMVTMEAEKPRMIEAISAGVNQYVIKPFTAEELTDTVKETLAQFSPSTVT